MEGGRYYGDWSRGKLRIR